MEHTALERLAEAVVERLTVPLEASGRHVHLCRADVDRAVLNLLDNAARFTPAGGGPPRRGAGPLQHGDGGQGGAHPPPGRTLDREAARKTRAASLYFPPFRAMIRGRV